MHRHKPSCLHPVSFQQIKMSKAQDSLGTQSVGSGAVGVGRLSFEVNAPQPPLRGVRMSTDQTVKTLTAYLEMSI